MKILALDLGTKTGWCCGDSEEIPSFGTLVLARAKEITQWGKLRMSRYDDPRITRLYKWVKGVCAEVQPDILIWEDVQFTSYTFQVQLWASLRTAIQLGARAGLGSSNSKPVRFDCVPVTTLKLFATGYGNAKKDGMQRALARNFPQYNLSDCDDNAIDAIWLWRWAVTSLSRIEKPNEPNRANESEEPEATDVAADLPIGGEHDDESAE